VTARENFPPYFSAVAESVLASRYPGTQREEA
jgi:hypothetical protein